MRALILAGGSGTRFWPLSRKSRPKQLLALDGEASLLRQTLLRLQPLVPPAGVWICTTEALADAVRADLPEVPPEQVLAEPEGRNTAPAIGWAVRSMPEEGRAGVIAVLPSDHRIAEPEAFRATLAAAGRLVDAEDRMMALGVVPRWAETGYGYLQLDPGASSGAARRVERFVEKPDAESAARFVASGRHLWNAGMFVFRGATLLRLLAEHQPELARGLEEIAAHPGRLRELYRSLPADSIDYALMEKLDSISTLPLDCGWSDLGSWEALYEVLEKDGAGNCGRGAAIALEAGGNLLFADQGTVAVLGVQNLVVVRTGDAVLVLPRERSQEVRKIVGELQARGRGELL